MRACGVVWAVAFAVSATSSVLNVQLKQVHRLFLGGLCLAVCFLALFGMPRELPYWFRGIFGAGTLLFAFGWSRDMLRLGRSWLTKEKTDGHLPGP
jgi:hypothetical protein